MSGFARDLPFGATLIAPDCTRFRLWAPSQQEVAVEIEGQALDGAGAEVPAGQDAVRGDVTQRFGHGRGSKGVVGRKLFPGAL